MLQWARGVGRGGWARAPGALALALAVALTLLVLLARDWTWYYRLRGELSLEELEKLSRPPGAKKHVKIPLKFDKCYSTRDYRLRVENGTKLARATHQQLRELERRRWEELKPHLPRIRGFYHTSLWRKFWAEVIVEQLSMMDAQLLEVADLYFNVVGSSRSDLARMHNMLASAKAKGTLTLKHADRISFNFNETVARFVYKRARGAEFKRLHDNPQISEGEYSTLAAMQDYCAAERRAGREAYAFYLHNKGGCCHRTKSSNKVDPTNDNVCAWREVMNAFNIEFPSVCGRALRTGNYAACGVEFLVDYHTAHYSGNFFWANCRHIVALAPMTSRFDSFAAELLLFNRSAAQGDRESNRRFGQRCGYSAFNCCVDFYKQDCKREFWDWKLYQLLDGPGGGGGGTLAPSNTDFAATGGHPAKNECF